MKIKYVGYADRRVIRSSDLPDLDEDFEDLIWTPDQVLDVPDSVGETLTTIHRQDFKVFTPEIQVDEDTVKPLSEMTVEELRTVAKVHEENGWEFDKPISKMKKGTLIDELEEIMAQEAQHDSGNEATPEEKASIDHDATGESGRVPEPVQNQEEMPRRV